MVDVRKRLARAIDERKLSYKDVSLELGKNHAYIQQFIKRGIPANLPEDVRGRLSEMLAIPEWELGGKQTHVHFAGHGKAEEPGDVANLTIFGGAGLGSTEVVEGDAFGNAHAEYLSGYWTFPNDVKAGWRNMPSVYSMQVIGDSMEPTLASGSYVFVDMTHKVPQPEDIYACDFGDGVAIKRLQLVPRTDKIRVMSDNTRYPTHELLREDVRVYGRVVGWFQWRG